MTWPLISDFSRMLQNPQLAFRMPALKACTIEMDSLGQPRARSGNFATVYRGYRPDGSMLAIRVFNRRMEYRQEAYEAKSRYLQDRQVGCLADFQYDPRGIRSASDGKLYPLLNMDWVPGVTLFEWVRDRCQEGYRGALSRAAETWLQLVRELADHQLVHGDLQHGNVLVDQGWNFKLVDYDCLGVPEMMGHRTLEVGLVPYQHPQRDSETALFEGLDNFSALVIYVALRGVAADPRLWSHYVDACGYDKMLFRREDFAAPASSRLYQDLLRSPDEQVRGLAYYLFQLVHYPLWDVPPIDEVLLWCNSLDELLAQRDWDKAVQLAARMRRDELTDPQCQAVVEAQRRVAARDALAEALRGGSERDIQRCYVPELLDDYPAAAHLVGQARDAGQVIRVLDVLSAARRFGNWQKFRATWDANYELLRRRPSARPYKEELKRLRAADAVRALLAAPEIDGQAVIEAWRYLASLGGHPTGEPLKPLVAMQWRRQKLLQKLEQQIASAPPVPTILHDKKLIADWTRSGLDESAMSAAVAQAWQAGRQRLAQLERLRQLAEQHTAEAEQQIVREAVGLPATYHPNLAQRVKLARKRVRCLRRLRDALGPPRSDRRLVDAWRRLGVLKGQNLLSPEQRREVELATERQRLVRSLANLETSLPPAELDRRLLETWDPALLDDCSEAEPWRARYEQARRRRQLLDQVAAACARLDVAALEPLLADPLLEASAMPKDLAEQVAQVRQQAVQQHQHRRHRLIATLLELQPGNFAQLFDAGLLREICRELPHHQNLVRRWVEAELLTAAALGLQVGPSEGLHRTGPSTIRLSWTWPAERFAEQCIIGVCRQTPGAGAGPDDVQTLLRLTVDRAACNARVGGVQLPVEADWDGAGVFVWAVIDLGFQVFYSQPLELGRIAPWAEGRTWRLFKTARRTSE